LATVPLEHDKVVVPEPPLIEEEPRVQERLVEFVVTESVTVPVKPLTGATVIVKVPEAPMSTATLVRLAFTVYSWTW
jgi:hypothetical protein